MFAKEWDKEHESKTNYNGDSKPKNYDVSVAIVAVSFLDFRSSIVYELEWIPMLKLIFSEANCDHK